MTTSAAAAYQYRAGSELPLYALKRRKAQKQRGFRAKSTYGHCIKDKVLIDPACGSGNFLTETYISIRKLENRVLENLFGGQTTLGFTEEELNPIKVQINQFYGIEINDFAVSVAKTALWIAEQQMMQETEEITNQYYNFLPLTSNPNIVEGNALRIDWDEILPAEKCNYIIGNPPFNGSSTRSKTQTQDMEEIAFKNIKKWGKLDYCSAWYYMSARYMKKNNTISAALVSTNSICQGEQVQPMWQTLSDWGVHINFAYKTFVWDNEAIDKAHVHYIIVGFSYSEKDNKTLWTETTKLTAKLINGYLSNAPIVFIPARVKPIDVYHKHITKGNQPVDGKQLQISSQKYASFIKTNPELASYVKPYIGADEFINSKQRFVLWLRDAPIDNLVKKSTELSNRLAAIRHLRLQSPTKEFQKFADKPHLFTQDRQPSSSFLLLPRVSSERRIYAPIGFMSHDNIVSDSVYIIVDANLFDFGLCTSLMHNAWMRIIAGRLKSDYRYSPIVYNSFAYPDTSDEIRAKIEQCAQAVLDARAAHEGKSLADLYDPDKMPKDLFEAHKALDAAVEKAYGVNFNGDEEKIVAHLFKLYAAITGVTK